MYCENFQDKSLSKGEFWSFTMVLDIVELSDKECGSNSILSVVTKGPRTIWPLKSSLLYFGTPCCDFKEGTIYLAGEVKERKERENCKLQWAQSFCALGCWTAVLPPRVVHSFEHGHLRCSPSFSRNGVRHSSVHWSQKWQEKKSVVDHGKPASPCSSQQPPSSILKISHCCGQCLRLKSL